MDLETQLLTLVDLALQEDGANDATSEALFEKGNTKEAVIIAKQDGVVCGIQFLEKIAHRVDPDILVDPFLFDGNVVKQRMMIGALEGDILSLLKLERVLLNFLGRLSGIATLTSQYVKAIEGTGAVILDTRKTVPGWRYLDKFAVKTGGGINHRMGLDDVLLVKDTHVDSMGGMKKALDALFSKNVEKPVIVEVRDMKEFQVALEFSKSLNRIMLDNFSVEMIEEAVGIASGKILLEASGGITLENARQIAETGIHFLSIGSLTHSAKAFDMTFKVS
ncbi:MAG: carboxylating nicotinate-nucleotide diphosphorylase [Candidatus Altimarinota bacterium]